VIRIARWQKGDKYLNLRSSNPSYSRKFILKQEVIRLIIKTPLTDDQICACVLYSIDHIIEFFFFVVTEPLEFLYTRNIKFVLGFGTRRLKGTRKNGKFGIFDG